MRQSRLNDLPVFVFPTVLHLSDILFTWPGGFTEMLWIVLLASAVQTEPLFYAWSNNRQIVRWQPPVRAVIPARCGPGFQPDLCRRPLAPGRQFLETW